MAKVDKGMQGPNTQGSENQRGKTNGFLFGLIAFLTALVVMAAVIGGAFYIVIHNNVKGIGENLGPKIQGIAALKWMLPPVPDPEDPKYLTDAEIKNRYQDLRKLKAELTKQLEDANKKIADLQKYKGEGEKLKSENDKLKTDMEAQKAQMEQQKKQLEDDRKKVEELIAKGDKAGFKEYFEKVEKETAQKIYEDIMKEQKADSEAKKFAQLYDGMEPSATSKILEQLGTSKMDLVVNILKNMNKETTGQVLAAMTPEFAAKVTEKMSKQYMPDNTQD